MLSREFLWYVRPLTKSELDSCLLALALCILKVRCTVILPIPAPYLAAEITDRVEFGWFLEQDSCIIFFLIVLCNENVTMSLRDEIFRRNFGQYRNFYGTDREFVDRTYFISSRASTYTHRERARTLARRYAHTGATLRMFVYGFA